MTHEELIEKARLQIDHATCAEDCGFTVDELTESNVVETVLIYFTSREHFGKVKVYMNRHTGDVIETIYIPTEKKSPRVS
jgi:hypothetical protein